MRAYFHYIGKAQSEEERRPCHLLPYHLMDVAAVGYEILRIKPQLLDDLADFLDVTIDEARVLVLFGLLQHDLGKMTASFQWLFKDRDLARVELPPGVNYDGKNARHDQLGWDVWHRMRLPSSWGEGREVKRLKRRMHFYMGLYWGHHGCPVRNEETIHDSTRITERDIEAAEQWTADALELLDVDLPLSRFDDPDFRRCLPHVSWLVAGLSIYCDWVGSDNRIFHYHDEPFSTLGEYWHDIALPSARQAVAGTEAFSPIKVSPFPNFESVFSFPPSPLQALAAELPIGSDPQLFILEDLTGSGKTEAALTLTHRLIEVGVADGFYIGLPTMATSNAMFSRVSDHYSRMLRLESGQAASIVLAHGARDMNASFREARLGESRPDHAYGSGDETASIHCSDWLADSRKKALLAPVGVGTIDQVLLAALPKKHQPLRALGLYRKVLVVDEVHAADIYMLRLLENVFQLHARQGGSVVLLTATLANHQRRQLVRAWQAALDVDRDRLIEPRRNDFPLLTTVSASRGVEEHEVQPRAGTEKLVRVRFAEGDDECVEHILDAVAQQRCVVWVRNSVDEAVSAYERLKGRLPEGSDLQLFHSRFILQHRQDKEAWVMEHFGKRSTKAERAGRVLIATQVFQESLDADADVMISDLCLIDDLVQRAGRLHRHKRDASGNPQLDGEADGRPEPILIVNAPPWQSEPDEEWLMRHSPNTQYVYQAPGKIWLTNAYLREQGAIRLPEDARAMIDYVYDNEEAIPEALRKAEFEWSGKERANSSQGISNRLDLSEGYSLKSSSIWVDDKVEVGTRLGEEAVQVLLVQQGEYGIEPLMAGIRHAVDLSTLRLSSKKVLEALKPVGEEYIVEITKRYKYVRYMVLVDINDQKDVSYSYDHGLRQIEES